MLSRTKSYSKLKLIEPIEDTESEVEIGQVHSHFADWFNSQYFTKINDKIIHNSMDNKVVTHIKIHLPQDILKQYHIDIKIDKSRVYLPHVTYDKVRTFWKDNGWQIGITDDIYYIKKSKSKIYRISSWKDNLHKKFVIIRFVIFNELEAKHYSNNNSIIA